MKLNHQLRAYIILILLLGSITLCIATPPAQHTPGTIAAQLSHLHNELATHAPSSPSADHVRHNIHRLQFIQYVQDASAPAPTKAATLHAFTQLFDAASSDQSALRTALSSFVHDLHQIRTQYRHKDALSALLVRCTQLNDDIMPLVSAHPGTHPLLHQLTHTVYQLASTPRITRKHMALIIAGSALGVVTIAGIVQLLNKIIESEKEIVASLTRLEQRHEEVMDRSLQAIKYSQDLVDDIAHAAHDTREPGRMTRMLGTLFPRKSLRVDELGTNFTQRRNARRARSAKKASE